MLQKTNIDLNEAASVLERVYKNISDIRESYDSVKKEAEELAKKWKINVTFKDKRQFRKKKQFDELLDDYRFDNSEAKFKTNIFFYVIDQVTSQLKTRFDGMKMVRDYFDFLNPKTVLECTESIIIKKCEKFCEKYSEIVSNNLVIQYQHLINLVKSELNETMNIRQFFQIIIKNFNSLESDMPDVYMAFLIFFTLPVTVASVERSFSKLKLIKNYLRSTMSQSRLSQLSLLSIESARAEEIDISELINVFANTKARKRAF